MIEHDIVFKGTRNGIVVTFNKECDFESIKAALEKRLSKSKTFFKNSKIFIDFSGSNIDELHQRYVSDMILKDYGISVHNVEHNRQKAFNGTYEGKTKFLKDTIRSGQSINYSGNIVVIGDVNAGGEVIAGGNIIVLGALRGMVHAGKYENEKAVIAAFALQPTQLRIASIISRAPDGLVVKPRYPEIAKVKDGSIVIEPCAPNKLL